jgi:SNF2 family DNA or RNA helicase
VLLIVRKICAHPYLLPLIEPNMNDNPTDQEKEEHDMLMIEASGKLRLLARMLAVLKEGGHRVLIFSQFKLVHNILENFLDIKKYSYVRLVRIAVI